MNIWGKLSALNLDSYFARLVLSYVRPIIPCVQTVGKERKKRVFDVSTTSLKNFVGNVSDWDLSR